jgi:hypothetical protein
MSKKLNEIKDVLKDLTDEELSELQHSAMTEYNDRYERKHGKPDESSNYPYSKTWNELTKGIP